MQANIKDPDFPDYKTVRVAWLDSINAAAGGWIDRDEVEREYLDSAKQLCHSIGYLIAENDEVLLIAHTRGEALGIVAGAYTIPQAAVVSRREYGG